MKPIHYFYVLLISAVTLFGCVPTASSITPAWTEAHSPTPTAIPTTSTPTLMPTLRPTWTATLTPPATFSPEQAKETIETLLQEPVDCESPCFWGIIPAQTTLGEARNIFIRLQLPIANRTYEGKDFYGINYAFDNGLTIDVTLTVSFQDKVVENLRVDINPEKQKVGVSREWSAYSPETLIKRYGTPSRVDFFVGRGTVISYAMNIYFDKVNLIVEYGGYDVGVGKENSFRICPLIDQQDGISLWLGTSSENPPGTVVSLEEATSLTLEKFSQLILGDPKQACIELKEELFP